MRVSLFDCSKDRFNNASGTLIRMHTRSSEDVPDDELKNLRVISMVLHAAIVLHEQLLGSSFCPGFDFYGAEPIHDKLRMDEDWKNGSVEEIGYWRHAETTLNIINGILAGQIQKDSALNTASAFCRGVGIRLGC